MSTTSHPIANPLIAVSTARTSPPRWAGPSPLFGAGLEFWRDPVPLMTSLAETYPDMVRVRLGTQHVHFVNSPVLARRILQANPGNYSQMAYVTERIRCISGENLFTAAGDQWHLLRKLMQPSFSRASVGAYAQIMSEEAHRRADEWAASPGATVSVSAAMAETTFNIITRVLSDVTPPNAEALRAAFSAGAEYISYRVKNPFAPPPHIPTPKNLRIQRGLRLVSRHVRDIVEARKRDLQKHDDFLQVLIDAHRADTAATLTARQFEDQILTFYFGGNGPPAKVLTWALYLLSRHRHVEKQLHHEIDSVLNGRAPTLADVAKLPYSRRIIDEILRMYPTAWAMPRTALGDDEVGPYRIAKGESLFVLVYTIHRHREYWRQPETFNPDRFDPSKDQSPMDARAREVAYFPFGLGQRSCIAGHLSMMVMQLALVSLAQRVILRCPADYEVVPSAGFPLGPAGPVLMTVYPRSAGAGG